MRIVVTGKEGQVVRALSEVGPRLGAEIVTVGRPEMDLAAPATVATALTAHCPDVIVSAAAHTAVDKAECEPDEAFAVNAFGAAAVARAAASLGVPVIYLYRLCFRRRQAGALYGDRSGQSNFDLRPIETSGGTTGGGRHPRSCHSAHRLGLFALWSEFFENHAAAFGELR